MSSELPLPTDAELKILNVLWSQGSSTVRDVMAHLDTDQEYTTVLKHLQIMHEKGLVSRDESGRAHVYSATRDEADTQRLLVEDLLDRAFSGSAESLVMRALSSEEISKEELDKIRDLIDRADDADNNAGDS
jgi:Predicted transcriptional regulator